MGKEFHLFLIKCPKSNCELFSKQDASSPDALRYIIYIIYIRILDLSVRNPAAALAQQTRLPQACATLVTNKWGMLLLLLLLTFFSCFRIGFDPDELEF